MNLVRPQFLSPYASVSILRGDKVRATLAEVIACLDSLARSLTTIPDEFPDGSVVKLIEESGAAGFYLAGGWYRVSKPPSWLRPSGISAEEASSLEECLTDLNIADTKHHLCLLTARKSHLLLLCTQQEFRERLLELISNGYAGSSSIVHTAELVSVAETEDAFVRGPTRQAWLDGLHSATVLKASKKNLEGPNLRYALDRFGDQTFTYSAAISEHPLLITGSHKTKSGQRKPTRVGVSYGKQVVWTGASRNVQHLLENFELILKLLDNDEDDISGLPVVSKPVESIELDEVKGAFEVSLVPLADQKPGAPPEEEDHRFVDEEQWELYGDFRDVQEVKDSCRLDEAASPRDGGSGLGGIARTGRRLSL